MSILMYDAFKKAQEIIDAERRVVEAAVEYIKDFETHGVLPNTDLKRAVAALLALREKKEGE